MIEQKTKIICSLASALRRTTIQGSTPSSAASGGVLLSYRSKLLRVRVWVYWLSLGLKDFLVHDMQGPLAR